jgi:putative ABC transport system ATP-binding protein
MLSTPDNDALVELRDVSKTYRTGDRYVTVLADIDLQLEKGEYASIVGPSGAGKSTLLNILTGIDRATTGEVYVDGRAIHKLNENKLARWRGRSIGVVFQFFQLLPTLTILENVMMPMDFCHVYRWWKRRKEAMALLEQVGIARHANKLPSALSGGEQQRAAIARALANDPPIVVADEPTGNLDSTTATAVLDLFDMLVAQGKTVIIVTHDKSLSTRARRQIHLLDGRIVKDTISDAFKARETTPEHITSEVP